MIYDMADRPADNLVCIGEGVRAHGIRGEVRLTALSGEPGRFREGLVVRWRRAGLPERSLTVAHARDRAGKVFVRFAEISDRNEAETLHGGRLWSDASESPKLAAESGFYHHQLLGLSVCDTSDVSGVPLGRLTGVYESGAHDNYEVTMADGRTFMVPAVAEFIDTIDIDAGVMAIRPIAGLIPDPDDTPPRRRTRRRRAG